MKPLISMIAAISENRVIGEGNKLPWHLPEDLKRFRDITRGHPVIMGRKTYESIGHPLPNRVNIIITRDQKYSQEGCVIVHSIEDAIAEAKKTEQNEIFIIGGGQIFAQALKYADKLYLTRVHKTIEGDAYFPKYPQFTKEVFRQEGQEKELKYTFVNLVKV